MFYRIRDDTTGCEPRKLFNGAPPAVVSPAVVRAAVVRAGDGIEQGAQSLPGETDVSGLVLAQSSSF